MKNKLLFVCALPIELKIVKEKVKNLNLTDFDIDFLCLWVWSYNTIYSIKDYLDKNWKPDFVVNIWVCGTSSKSIFDDYFQVYRIKNLENSREVLVPIYIKILPLKSINSSEKIITDKIEMQWEDFVDMESFWVDFVCTKEKLPYIIVKRVFDEVWKESKDVDLVSLKNILADFDYFSLIISIWKWLENNKKNDLINENLDYYKDYFRFTFSEFEQFKKDYSKLKAYKKDFKNFFEKNKDLKKEEFLSKINKI